MPHHLLVAMSSAMLAAMSDATSVFMSSMVEHVALSVTFIFDIDIGLGLGLVGFRSFCDSLEMS